MFLTTHFLLTSANIIAEQHFSTFLASGPSKQCLPGKSYEQQNQETIFHSSDFQKTKKVEEVKSSYEVEVLVMTLPPCVKAAAFLWFFTVFS